MSEELVEQVRDWRGTDLEIDAAKRVVRNVVLSGANSRNGHRYTEESLRQGAGLYASKPVFLDHAPSGSKPQERSTRDLVGSITGARYESGRIRGDIQVLKTPAGETFLELVESNTPQVGMSHVVVVERGRDPKVVESIRDVISVDAVVYPATTTTFQEGVTLLDKPAEFPDTVQEERIHLLEEELQATKEELVSLKLEQERVRRSQADVERMLSEARLPESVVTEEFRELLLDERSAGLREELIRERRELARKWESVKPRSVERRGVVPARDDKWVVSLLKGNRRAA